MARGRTGWASVVVLAIAVAPVAAEEHPPGREVPSQGNVHLQSPGSPHPPYHSVPPTSGPHVPWLAPWGMHRIPIPWEIQVHNLEDGGVIIHYRCDRPCPEPPEALARLVTEYPTQVIVAPEPRLSTAFALTAWGRLAVFDALDEEQFRRFIDAYRGLDHHPPKSSTPSAQP
ncbi:MAG: DUF3105 domain-containing protein [Nitrospiria bacterium]